MMRSKTKMFVALLVILLCVSAAQGQDVQAPQPGHPDGHPYQIGDFDDVDVASGNVNIRIPIVKFDQAGDLSLSYSFRASGKLMNVVDYTVTSGCPLSGDDAPQCTPTSENYNYWVNGINSPLLTIDQDIQTSSVCLIDGYYVAAGFAAWELPSQECIPTLTTADSTSHIMLRDVNSGQWWTDDGSGYRGLVATGGSDTDTLTPIRSLQS